jgi:hypothetical protein
MLQTVRTVIRRKPMLPSSPDSKAAFSSSFQVRVPEEPISKAYLEELCRIFWEVQIVKKAAYVLYEESKQTSYMILLDLDVKPGQEEPALSLIANAVIPYQQPPFSGRLPVAFSIWDEALMSPTLQKAPVLRFY